MRYALLLAAAVITCPSIVAAQAAHVPGDYPTIQTAIDAGANPIYVAAGTYHEIVDIRNDLQLLAEQPFGNLPSPAVPIVDGAIVAPSADHPSIAVRGFHFLHGVTVAGGQACGGAVAFESCRMDSSFIVTSSCPIIFVINLRSCQIFGSVEISAGIVEVAANTVIGGGIAIRVDGSGIVRDNFVLGPGDIGIRAYGGDAPTVIAGNTVRGVRQGIDFFYGRAEHNLVKNCTGTGITAVHGPVAFNVVEDCGGDGVGTRYTDYSTPTVDVAYNLIRRCGGHGINFDVGNGAASFRGNQVNRVGLSGIHTGLGTAAIVVDSNEVQFSGSHGVWLESDGEPRRNLVLNSRGDGIRCSQSADGNVVGRCAGTGIVAASARSNTSYLNGGSGYQLAGNLPIGNNIAYRNAAYGLRWVGAGDPSLSCNDWFDNTAGNTLGATPGPSDISLYPAFCDVDRDTVSLRSGSPLLDAPSCGLIGALGQGCIDIPTATLDPGGGQHADPEQPRLALLPPAPNPASRDVSIAFTLPRELDVSATVMDVNGRRVASLVRDRLGPGRHDVHWNPGRPGAYFVRMEADGQRLTQRLHVVR